MAQDDDYAVHPTVITAWQLIGTTIGVFIVIVIGAWTIIGNEANNNRDITVDLRTNYVTMSNHNDLVSRFNREVGRVDDLARESISRREFNAWKTPHDKAIDSMKADIDWLRQNTITRREYDGVVNERGKQIDALRSEAENRNSKNATKEELTAHSMTDTERVQSLRREVDALRAELNALRSPKEGQLR